MRREGWKLTCSVSSSRNFKSTASPVSLFVTGITLFKASARREGGISIAVVTIYRCYIFHDQVQISPSSLFCFAGMGEGVLTRRCG
jgi:hypothetical protein